MLDDLYFHEAFSQPLTWLPGKLHFVNSHDFFHFFTSSLVDDNNDKPTADEWLVGGGLPLKAYLAILGFECRMPVILSLPWVFEKTQLKTVSVCLMNDVGMSICNASHLTPLS